MIFEDGAYIRLLGGLFEDDLPDEPNVDVGAIQAAGFAVVEPNLWLSTDELLTNNWGGFSIEGRMDVNDLYRNWAYMVVQKDGELNVSTDNTVLHAYHAIGGGKMNFTGDVSLWHQPHNTYSSLQIWDDWNTGQPGEVNVEGNFALNDRNGTGSVTLLLNESDFNVGGLDLRHAKSSYPDRSGQDLHLYSGNIRVKGGALQVPEREDWSFGPSHGGNDDRRNLNLYLLDGAQFLHDHAVTIGGGNQTRDEGCRGRIVLSGRSEENRSSARVQELTVGNTADESGWLDVLGAADLNVQRRTVIGDSGPGGIAFDVRDRELAEGNPRPTGDFHDDVYIGENGSSQAELTVRYGSVTAHRNVIMGRGDARSRLSVYTLGQANPGASEMTIAEDLEIGWDLWGARDHGPSTVVTFGGGAIDVDGRLGLGRTSYLYLGAESNVACDGAMVKDAGNLLFMGGDFEVDGIVRMEGKALQIPMARNGLDPESELRFVGASGDLLNDFFVGHGGEGCRGLMTVTPGSELRYEGLLTVGDGEAVGHVDFQRASSVDLNSRQPVMIGDGSSMELDGTLNGWSIEMDGDHSAVRVSCDGGRVDLQKNLDIRSLDTHGRSSLSVEGGAVMSIGANLASDHYDFQTNTQTVANGTRAHVEMNFWMTASPQTFEPVLKTKSFFCEGNLLVHGDKSITGSNIGQIWPLAESILPMDGHWWNGGEVIDDDPADGIAYILHQDANKISVEIRSEIAGDIDGSGQVDINDLIGIVRNLRRPCQSDSPVQVYCQTDVDRDGDTDMNDLMLAIGNFGW